MGALSALFRRTGLGAASDWTPLVTAEANTQGVDPSLAIALMMTESGGNAGAINPADPSYGLFQVTPATASWLAGRPISPDDLLDPATNARFGIAYLRYQLDRYGGDVASAVNAYRAGTASNTPRSQSYVARFFGFLDSLGSGGIAIAAPSSGAATGAPGSPEEPLGSLAGLTAWIGAHWPWLVGGAVVLYLARR
mgnify:CR=1 FL=1